MLTLDYIISGKIETRLWFKPCLRQKMRLLKYNLETSLTELKKFTLFLSLFTNHLYIRLVLICVGFRFPAVGVQHHLVSTVDERGVVRTVSLRTVPFDNHDCTPLIRFTVTIANLDAGKEDQVLEAKVFRKWISKSLSDMKDQAFCCVLIDIQVG